MTDRTPELGTFVGTWQGRGVFRTDELAADITCSWNVEWAAGGTALLGRMAVRGIPGAECVDSVDLLARDEADGHLHWLSVCNLHEVHDRRGGWVDGVLVAEDARERLRVVVASPDRLQVTWRVGDHAQIDMSFTR